MNIEIICIGNLKESYLREAEKEYSKRLTPYCKISVLELNEKREPKGAGEAEKEIVRNTEGKALISAAENRSGSYIFALDMRGKQQTSEEFANTIQKLSARGKSSIIFLIGGSLGLSDNVLGRADAVISFSEMTFPHQLIRVFLLEQLYRAHKILRGEPYHK